MSFKHPEYEQHPNSYNNTVWTLIAFLVLIALIAALNYFGL